jgi:hypothetical protein
MRKIAHNVGASFSNSDTASHAVKTTGRGPTRETFK